MVTHSHVHAQIIDRRLTHGTQSLVERRLLGEVVRWEALLLMHLEWVDILEMLGLYVVRLYVLWEVIWKAIEGALLSSMQATL